MTKCPYCYGHRFCTCEKPSKSEAIIKAITGSGKKGK